MSTAVSLIGLVGLLLDHLLDPFDAAIFVRNVEAPGRTKLDAVSLESLPNRNVLRRKIGIAQQRGHAKAHQISVVGHGLALIAEGHELTTEGPHDSAFDRPGTFAEVARVLMRNRRDESFRKEESGCEIRSVVAIKLCVAFSTGVVEGTHAQRVIKHRGQFRSHEQRYVRGCPKGEIELL